MSKSNLKHLEYYQELTLEQLNKAIGECSKQGKSKAVFSTNQLGRLTIEL